MAEHCSVTPEQQFLKLPNDLVVSASLGLGSASVQDLSALCSSHRGWVHVEVGQWPSLSLCLHKTHHRSTTQSCQETAAAVPWKPLLCSVAWPEKNVVAKTWVRKTLRIFSCRQDILKSFWGSGQNDQWVNISTPFPSVRLYIMDWAGTAFSFSAQELQFLLSPCYCKRKSPALSEYL